jgi:hypothetical protein
MKIIAGLMRAHKDCHDTKYELLELWVNEIHRTYFEKVSAGNTEGGSITVPLTSCLTGLDESVLQIKTKIVSCHTADSKSVRQELNSIVILPPLVFLGFCPKYNFSTAY